MHARVLFEKWERENLIAALQAAPQERIDIQRHDFLERYKTGIHKVDLIVELPHKCPAPALLHRSMRQSRESVNARKSRKTGIVLHLEFGDTSPP